MNGRRPFLMLLVFCASGCVVYQSNTLESRGTSQILVIANTGRGLMFGPCTPYIGKTRQVEARIRLKGIRDSYAPGDFELVDEAGKVIPFEAQPEGEIVLNRSARVAEIRLYYQQKALPINGQYRFKTLGNG